MKQIFPKLLLVTFSILGVIIFVAYTPKSYSPILFNSATLNFPSVDAGSSAELTITVSGAVAGDCVALGVPSGVLPSNGVFTATVSSSNTVSVRFTNTDLVGSLDPASGLFKACVFKK